MSHPCAGRRERDGEWEWCDEQIDGSGDDRGRPGMRRGDELDLAIEHDAIVRLLLGMASGPLGASQRPFEGRSAR